MRLDKFIASVTDYSRSDAKRLIKAARITVNQVLAADPSKHIETQTDQVCLDDVLLNTLSARYFMLHKPAGYVSANKDSEHPTVLDLFDEPQKCNLQIVGRLDIDTTGLLFLTDDGQWNHRVTTPHKKCFKTYRVALKHPLTADLIATFKAGIALKNESKPSKPAQLKLLSAYQAELSIQEGKYHQVKRMFAAVGNRVIKLHRHSIGNVQLDTHLSEGQYRSLSETEINAFL